MSEIKERPDAPCGPGEVWEREHDGALFCVHLIDGELLWRRFDSIANLSRMYELAPRRYRKRTLHPLPWPAEPKVEQRRLVVVRATGDAFHVYVEPVRYPPTSFAYIVLDEIRSCEVDGEGRVVKILPVEEK